MVAGGACSALFSVFYLFVGGALGVAAFFSFGADLEALVSFLAPLPVVLGAEALFLSLPLLFVSFLAFFESFAGVLEGLPFFPSNLESFFSSFFESFPFFAVLPSLASFESLSLAFLASSLFYLALNEVISLLYLSLSWVHCFS